jgi:hypothetical protein
MKRADFENGAFLRKIKKNLINGVEFLQKRRPTKTPISIEIFFFLC